MLKLKAILSSLEKEGVEKVLVLKNINLHVYRSFCSHSVGAPLCFPLNISLYALSTEKTFLILTVSVTAILFPRQTTQIYLILLFVANDQMQCERYEKKVNKLIL